MTATTKLREMYCLCDQCSIKQILLNPMKQAKLHSLARLALTGAMLGSAHPAFAQISSTASTLLGNVNSFMLGIGGVIVTCALMFVGFRMVFQAAEWKDVAPVFWGGVLIGSAAAIGPQLIS